MPTPQVSSEVVKRYRAEARLQALQRNTPARFDFARYRTRASKAKMSLSRIESTRRRKTVKRTMNDKTESNDFRLRVQLLLLDKGVLAVALLIIALSVEDEWRQSSMDLENARFSIEQILRLSNETIRPDMRAVILKSVADREGIEPYVVAGHSRDLLLAGASEKFVTDAIADTMERDLAPFLQSAEIAVRGQRLSRIIDESQTDPQKLLTVWENIFRRFLQEGNLTDPVLSQLTDETLLGDTDYGVLETGSYHTLAILLAPDDTKPVHGRSVLDQARHLTELPIQGLNYIGHLALMVRLPQERFPEQYAVSYNFVAAKLQRETVSDADNGLLSEEIRIIADSINVFGTRISGKIAEVLADRYVTSQSAAVRFQAYKALENMFDCAVEAGPRLAEYIDSLTAQLTGLDSSSQRFWTARMGQEIAFLAELVLKMASEPARTSLNRLFENNAVRYNLPGLASRLADRYEGTRCSYTPAVGP